MKQIQTFWRLAEHLNGRFLSFNLSDQVVHKVLRKLENLLFKLINEEYDIRERKPLKKENPYRVIIGHINKNWVRNKLESLVKYVGNNLDILMVSETKIYTCPETQDKTRYTF